MTARYKGGFKFVDRQEKAVAAARATVQEVWDSCCCARNFFQFNLQTSNLLLHQ